MIIKQLMDEDFVNYHKPSMFIGFPSCTWKCERECGKRVCQNSALATSPDINIDLQDLVNRYVSNPITKSVVIGGLEPFDNWNDLKYLVSLLRTKTLDDIVIYTGYKEEEIKNQIRYLGAYRNIIIKFGRFVPDQESHYDEVLGVNLASPNQYARRIS
jgi:organic radical activating enzyme